MSRVAKFGLVVIVCMLVTAAAASVGFCCYSGLLVIPTAQTVGDGQYSYEFQTDGVIQGMAAETRLFNNEFGIGDRLELGVDVDLDSQCISRVLGNGKYVAYRSHSGDLSAAFGVSNLAHRWKSAPFVVGSTRAGLVHFHLGAMSIDGRACAICGIDRELGKLTLMADYTGGKDGLASVGFNYQIKESFGIMAGALLPNGDQDAGFTMHLVWCEPLKL